MGAGIEKCKHCPFYEENMKKNIMRYLAAPHKCLSAVYGGTFLIRKDQGFGLQRVNV